MKRIPFYLCILLLLFKNSATASHLIGGSSSYSYIKDTIITGQINKVYEVTFNLYEDCENGQPSAISADNPIFLSLYGMAGSVTILDSTTNY